ncbi:MAG: FAD-dependent oxidoreductase [Elusimicrobia bacterium]|nr:FAD-dependent oxidoreductase [Elusimicrobiota bacterium]
MPERSDILVLGGGLSGLSCATALAEAGRKVTVLEKKPHLGGRAHSFHDPDTGLTWDNGAHLFAGPCRNMTRFLRRIGRETQLRFPEFLRVDVFDGTGADSLRIPAALGARFGLLWAVWRLKGLEAADKWGILRLRRSLAVADPRDLDRLTARQWLDSLGQSRRIQDRLFDPLAMALLNEPPALASAAVVSQAFRELFMGGADAMRLGWSAAPLSELYAEPARAFIEARGGHVLLSTEVTRLMEDNGRVTAAADEWGQKFHAQAVVSTLPPWDLVGLELPAGLDGPWKGLESTPAVTVHLRFDRPVLDFPIAGMLGTTARWAFSRDAAGEGVGGQGRGRGLRPSVPPALGEGVGGQGLSLAVSAGRDVLKAAPAAFIEAALRDLAKCLPESRKARMTGWKVVKEDHARLSHARGTEERRPRPGVVLPGMSFAGDWTRTGFTASMESAVASGQRAAEELMQSHA